MTPTGAGAIASPDAVDPILQDGEEILLVVKPSAWQVVLGSLPTLLLTALAAAGVFAGPRLGLRVAESVRSLVLLGCAALAALRLAAMSIRWVGRLYILTNRRVIRMGGAVSTCLADCPLSHISDIAVVSATAERWFALGSLLFTVDGRFRDEIGWMNLAHPHQVAEEVRKAIAHDRHGRG
jgi:hypothetical protein